MLLSCNYCSLMLKSNMWFQLREIKILVVKIKFLHILGLRFNTDFASISSNVQTL
jgi:hypothetical protein